MIESWLWVIFSLAVVIVGGRLLLVTWLEPRP